MKKANKKLKDENYYKKISHDPKHEHMKIVNDTIETFHREQVLAKNIADFKNSKCENTSLLHNT